MSVEINQCQRLILKDITNNAKNNLKIEQNKLDETKNDKNITKHKQINTNINISLDKNSKTINVFQLNNVFLEESTNQENNNSIFEENTNQNIYQNYNYGQLINQIFNQNQCNNLQLGGNFKMPLQNIISMDDNNNNQNIIYLIEIEHPQIQMSPNKDQYDLIDIKNMMDAQYCPHYAKSVFQNLQKDENNEITQSNHLTNQNEINCYDRSSLINWLIEIHEYSKLKEETLFQSIRIMDQYLKKAHVQNKQYFVLLGATCLFIASKLNDLIPIFLNDLLYFTSSFIKFEQYHFVTMEKNILKTLNFELFNITPMDFLQRYAESCSLSSLEIKYSQYILEISLIEDALLDISQSQLVASTIYLVNSLNKRTPLWPDNMVDLTTYQEEDLYNASKLLHKLLINQNSKQEFQSSRNKYLKQSNVRIALRQDIDQLSLKNN